MVYKCFVAGCKTGTKRQAVELKRLNRKVPTLFAPDKKNFDVWKEVLPKKNRDFKMSDRVCALHFKKEDINALKEVLVTRPNGVMVMETKARALASLKKGAIPCIFPKVIQYKIEKTYPKGTKPGGETFKVPVRVYVEGEPQPEGTVMDAIDFAETLMREEAASTTEAGSKPAFISEIHSYARPTLESLNLLPDTLTSPAPPPGLSTSDSQRYKGVFRGPWSPSRKPPPEPLPLEVSSQELTLERLQQIARDVEITGPTWGVHSIPGVLTCFTILNQAFDTIKVVAFDTIKVVAFEKSLTPRVLVSTVPLDFPPVRTIGGLQSLLNEVSAMTACIGPGDGYSSASTVPRPPECTGIVVDLTKSFRCPSCLAARKKNSKKKSDFVEDSNEIRVQILRNKLKNEQRTVQRYKRKVSLLEEQIGMLILEFKHFTEKRPQLEDFLQDLPRTQQEFVRQCFKAAKCKSLSGRRYNPEWIQECLALRFDSPQLYKEMRESNILPLPSKGTLKKYLRNTDKKKDIEELNESLTEEVNSIKAITTDVVLVENEAITFDIDENESSISSVSQQDTFEDDITFDFEE